MMMVGFHWYQLVVLFVIVAPPIVVGFAWILPDANRRSMPGWLWALLTIPFGWLSVLAYAIVRR